jgi:ELWxxDGT repeat protein
LWTSNGTRTGTHLVEDIHPDPGAFGPSDLTPFHGNLYFKTTDPTHGREVWRTDGTRGGTQLLKDLLPGPDSLTSVMLTPIGNTLYIQSSELEGHCTFWRSDGTTAGTTPIEGVCPAGGSLTDVNGVAFFAGNDPHHGFELWKSDGTQAGTMRVKDITPGPEGSGPHYLTNVNGKLFFMARSARYGLYGFEIWTSDGTPNGTVLVKAVARP